MKICSNVDCQAAGLPQTLACFHKDASKPDGLRPRCKHCRKLEHRLRYLENRDSVIKKTRAYRDERVDAYRVYGANFRARKFTDEVLPASTWEDLLALYGERCMNPDCGSDQDLCIDHIVTMSKGGENRFENLQILCRTCNSRKNNHHSMDYRPFALELEGVYDVSH